MLKTFLTNSIRIPVEHHQLGCFNIDYLESEGVAAENKVLQSVPDKSTLSPSIKSAILDQLEKQQNDKFYDFDQHRIPSKLQNAFIAGTKVHKQNLPPKPISYQQLNGHVFEK